MKCATCGKSYGANQSAVCPHDKFSVSRSERARDDVLESYNSEKKGRPPRYAGDE